MCLIPNWPLHTVKKPRKSQPTARASREKEKPNQTNSKGLEPELMNAKNAASSATPSLRKNVLRPNHVAARMGHDFEMVYLQGHMSW